jgi:hypothetical protein
VNADEMIDLLTMIAAFDQRTIGEGDVTAWLIIATEEGWTLPLARRAVIDHHRRGGDRPRIRPAHITDAILAVKESARRAVLNADPMAPRDVDPAGWFRLQVEQAKERAVTAWANGDPLPELAPARIRAQIEAAPVPDVIRRLADTKRVPSARREAADRNQRAEGIERARAELHAVRDITPEAAR